MLPASENYQIGFRLAKSLGHQRIYITNARTDFDYPALIASAKDHHEENILTESDRLSEEFGHQAMAVQEHDTILDMYRFFNRRESIDALSTPYMLLARIGANSDYAGAKTVASWHLRNLEMFAQLTQLIQSKDERILILYGAGHAYLLRDFIRQSPDLVLVDPQQYLR